MDYTIYGITLNQAYIPLHLFFACLGIYFAYHLLREQPPHTPLRINWGRLIWPILITESLYAMVTLCFIGLATYFATYRTRNS